MGKRHKKPKVRVFYQVNQYIRAEKLRVVDEKGAQIGVMTKEEALKRAEADGIDLVEVSPKAVPPVAKLIDFAKFKYQQKQKNAQSLKKARGGDIKEIRFTPFIAENDYNLRIKRAQQFLEEGDKVRLVVKFVGRQITRKEFGESILEKALKDLAEDATVEREPSFKGKLLMATVNPLK
ncbi:MAG: translation initiation factor IF-3 [Candidatus Chisholmbacteria bacterium]|nr:translation initiation factor IF-3 [Candidatus Chisholmbacteria bacterium]